MSYKIEKSDIDAHYRNNEYLKQAYPTDKRMTNRINKDFARYEELINTPLVKQINARMHWVKNATWGMNPHATAVITYVDGTRKTVEGYKASGAGYSKSMHLLEQILNDNALQNLLAFFEKGHKGETKGVHLPNNPADLPWYGLGADSGKFANFTIDHYANNKDYDAYDIIFHNPSGTLLGKKTVATKMKGYNTAVWGKKSQKKDTIATLEHAVRKMI